MPQAAALLSVPTNSTEEPEGCIGWQPTSHPHAAAAAPLSSWLLCPALAPSRNGVPKPAADPAVALLRGRQRCQAAPATQVLDAGVAKLTPALVGAAVCGAAAAACSGGGIGWVYRLLCCGRRHWDVGMVELPKVCQFPCGHVNQRVGSACVCLFVVGWVGWGGMGGWADGCWEPRRVPRRWGAELLSTCYLICLSLSCRLAAGLVRPPHFPPCPASSSPS